MLVLSRRQGQRVLFPKLNIAVQVVGTNGSTVRLGINAPADVIVLREEIADLGADSRPPPDTETRLSHGFRGRLNTLAVALHLTEKQLKAGLTAEAAATLNGAQEHLQRLLPAEGPTPSGMPRKPVEALLVEDDPNEEALLSSYLRMSGFCVETARDGHETLEFLASHARPDVVLMDMRLPRIDGPATVAAIRENSAYCGLRIFAVSGSPRAEFDLPIGAGGVDAWFQKPLNPKRLVDAMSALDCTN
jgi:carbon storage regulator CsrA